jgi:hypothetical protein
MSYKPDTLKYIGEATKDVHGEDGLIYLALPCAMSVRTGRATFDAFVFVDHKEAMTFADMHGLKMDVPETGEKVYEPLPQQRRPYSIPLTKEEKEGLDAALKAHATKQRALQVIELPDTPSVKDLFAMAALQGLLANPHSPANIHEMAYVHAEAMMKERAKRQ